MSPLAITSIILVVTVILLFLPKVPVICAALFATIAMAITGVLPMKEVLQNYAGNTAFLIMSMMTIGAAMFHTGLAGWIGNKLMRLTGKSVFGIQLATFICAFVLAMACNASSTLAIMYPLMASIAISSKTSMSKIVPMQFVGSQSGSWLTSVGASTIIMVSSILEASGYRPLGFFEIAWFGFPRMLIFAPLAYYVTKKLIPDDRMVMPDNGIAEKADDLATTLTPQMIGVAVILLGTIVGLVINSKAYPTQYVAMTGALLCLLLGFVTPDQMVKGINWNVVIMIGGMTCCAKGMQASGLGQVIGETITNITGPNVSPITMIFVLIITTGILTQFLMDNTSSAIMAPIAIALATASGMEPYAYVMAVLVGSSLFHCSAMASPALSFQIEVSGLTSWEWFKWDIAIELLPALLCGMIMIPLVWL